MNEGSCLGNKTECLVAVPRHEVDSFRLAGAGVEQYVQQRNEVYLEMFKRAEQRQEEALRERRAPPEPSTRGRRKEDKPREGKVARKKAPALRLEFRMD